MALDIDDGTGTHMGIINDVLRLMAAGSRASAGRDPRRDLAESAALAERFSGPPTGDALGPDPFLNATRYGRMVQGSGTVRGIEPTGAEYDGVAVYAVDFEIRLPGRDPYRTRYVTILAEAARPNWQPGAMFPIRVDPDDPHAVALG